MRLLFILISILIVMPAQAAFHSQGEVLEWMNHYYQKPDPSRVVEAVEYVSQSGLLDKEEASYIFIGFLAGVFHDNPGRVKDWFDTLSNLKTEHLNVVMLGMWYANLPASKKVVYKM